MEQQSRTWAGLSPAVHAGREASGAQALVAAASDGEYAYDGCPYRLTVLDDDMDSEGGILCQRDSLADPFRAVAFVHEHYPREYAAGLYEIRPIRRRS